MEGEDPPPVNPMYSKSQGRRFTCALLPWLFFPPNRDPTLAWLLKVFDSISPLSFGAKTNLSGSGSQAVKL